MTTDTHAEHGAPASDPAAHAAHEAAGHRFEKIELEEFTDADRGAGQHIGILLALLFCVLFVLMSGATTWTFFHQFNGPDPHAVPVTNDHRGH